jgi:hypothetical protein
MSELNVRSRTLRTPSVEMPPGLFERAKPLAIDADIEFSVIGNRRDRPHDLIELSREGRSLASGWELGIQPAGPRRQERAGYLSPPSRTTQRQGGLEQLGQERGLAQPDRVREHGSK